MRMSGVVWEMNGRGLRRARRDAVTFVVWWPALFGLWLVLIGPVDVLEVVVGASAAALGAWAACLAVRAVRDQHHDVPPNPPPGDGDRR
ncbi:hypothetical protein AB0F77_36710 [Streptomyces sp. NPDC026672]|uniref:hypothetical protein n=1 Tax=unclassified Streptomyces TaxID=2593676 RepID=UPI00340F5377